ncbi:MAG: sugar phosphate isomerase/epimerase family protein [Halobacteriales archaeon]
MVLTAIQLFTVQDLSEDESLRRTLDRVADAGYDGVELNEEWYPLVDGTHRVDVDDLSLSVPAVQIPFSTLSEQFDDVLATYDPFSCRDYVIPYLDEDHFESWSTVKSVAELLSELATRLDAHDCRLHYHNHDFEFVSVDGGAAFDILVEETDDIRFEVDVGWAAAGGRDPVALLGELDGRVDLVHLKDMDVDRREPAELGAGDVDLDACVDAAERTGADWLVYEYDFPPDPAASIEHAGEWFRARWRPDTGRQQ